MTPTQTAAIRAAAERMADLATVLGEYAPAAVPVMLGAMDGILRLLDEAEKPCDICRTAGNFIGMSDYGDTRLFYRVSGAYMQVFDEEYPGFIDNIPIRFCPGCGREIKKEAPPMTPEIKQYFQDRYSQCNFSVVPGHWPDFKSREEVDEWISLMGKITAAFREESTDADA